MFFILNKPHKHIQKFISKNNKQNLIHKFLLTAHLALNNPFIFNHIYNRLANDIIHQFDTTHQTESEKKAEQSSSLRWKTNTTNQPTIGNRFIIDYRYKAAVSAHTHNYSNTANIMFMPDKETWRVSNIVSSKDTMVTIADLHGDPTCSETTRAD